MNLAHLARSGVVMAMGVLVVSPLGAGLSLTACGESGACTKLREDTITQKAVWDACEPNDPLGCIKVAGTTKDCTGVLSCDFAVDPHHRAEAEHAVLTIPQQSLGCYLCAQPNCVGGDIPYCEPVSKRCILVTQLLDGGGFSQTTTTPPPVQDAGSTGPTGPTGPTTPTGDP